MHRARVPDGGEIGRTSVCVRPRISHPVAFVCASVGNKIALKETMLVYSYVLGKKKIYIIIVTLVGMGTHERSYMYP